MRLIVLLILLESRSDMQYTTHNDLIIQFRVSSHSLLGQSECNKTESSQRTTSPFRQFHRDYCTVPFKDLPNFTFSWVVWYVGDIQTFSVDIYRWSGGIHFIFIYLDLLKQIIYLVFSIMDYGIHCLCLLLWIFCVFFWFYVIRILEINHLIAPWHGARTLLLHELNKFSIFLLFFCIYRLSWRFLFCDLDFLMILQLLLSMHQLISRWSFGMFRPGSW